MGRELTMMKKFCLVLAALMICMTACAAAQEIEIHVNDQVLIAELADNSSAEALAELLARGPVTIDMHDFSNFEKVGELPESLPANDEDITTEACDLILYLGHRFVIYYDTNSWDFTRLGRITSVTGEELREILGGGDVTVILSLPEETEETEEVPET